MRLTCAEWLLALAFALIVGVTVAYAAHGPIQDAPSPVPEQTEGCACGPCCLCAEWCDDCAKGR